MYISLSPSTVLAVCPPRPGNSPLSCRLEDSRGTDSGVGATRLPWCAPSTVSGASPHRPGCPLGQSRPQQLKDLLTESGIVYMPSDTHIIPILMGSPDRCKRAAALHQIYVQCVSDSAILSFADPNSIILCRFCEVTYSDVQVPNAHIFYRL